jgi:Protein of unknown function (DUF3540)
MAKVLERQYAITGQWLVGHVIADKDSSIRVKSGDLCVLARRAAGCLVEPEHGDAVACIKVAPTEVWIISVLSRESSRATVLSVHGDTEIKVNEGKLSMTSDSISMTTQRLTALAKQARIGVDSVNLVSDELMITSRSVKFVTSLLSTVAQRMTQFCKSYLRTTDGMDRVTANHVEVQAKQLMRLDAEHTLVTGKQLVKARGAQIHFG